MAISLSQRWSDECQQVTMTMRIRQLAMLVGILLITGTAAQVAHAVDHTLKFSAQDIAVLKALKRVKDLSDTSAKLLLSIPVWELLASPNPVDVTITLTTTDWVGVGAAAKGIQKIGRCRMAEIVQEHLSDATSERIPTGEAEKYFRKLGDSLDQQC